MIVQGYRPSTLRQLQANLEKVYFFYGYYMRRALFFRPFPLCRRAFSNISGAIELTTQLWLAEDACIAPSSTSIPLTTVALCFTLTPQDFKTPHHQVVGK